jgi:uncharacterized protein YndB with AHSA1/START domain
MYARVRRLPPLWKSRWHWMESTPPGVHPYHVAASFVGYLVETYGIAKVKQWYVNATEAQAAFGESFAQLERRWRDWLARREVAPEHERHVLEFMNLRDATLPASLSDAAWRPLFDGKTLDGLDAEQSECWTVRDGRVVGIHDGPWTALAAKARVAPGSAVRVRFRLASGNAFKVELSYASEKDHEAIFARWSAYLSCEDRHTGNEGARLEDSGWHDAVLTHMGGQWRVYLDGFQTLECEAPAPATDASASIAVERGEVEVAEFSVAQP